MILAWAFVLALVSVPLAGGKLARLAQVQLRWAGLLPVALAAQVIIISMPRGWPGLHRGVHLGSYGLVAAFVVANFRLPGLWLASLGGLLNAVAIVANGGVMPASPVALRAAGIAPVYGSFANSTAVAHPKLAALGDVFAIPAGWPLANVFSIGDVILVVGMFVTLHRLCGSRLFSKRQDDWRPDSPPSTPA